MDLINPIPAEWTKYLTQSPIGLEVIPDQLWDAQTYTDNSTTTLTFFAATSTTQSITNMTQPGMLPNPQSFLIEAMRIYFRTVVTTDDAGAAGAFASIYNDVVLLVNTSTYKSIIGTKNYGPWRPWMMPAASYAQGVMATAGAEAANLVHDYAQLGGPLWQLRPNLMIAPLQNFSALMLWDAAANLTANAVIEVMWEGQRARGIN